MEERLERAIEDLFRKVITQVGAVKTGRMRDSIQATVYKDSSGNWVFEVSAVYYFVYVDAYYDITSLVYSDPQFKQIEDGLADLMLAELSQDI